MCLGIRSTSTTANQQAQLVSWQQSRQGPGCHKYLRIASFQHYDNFNYFQMVRETHTRRATSVSPARRASHALIALALAIMIPVNGCAHGLGILFTAACRLLGLKRPRQWKRYLLRVYRRYMEDDIHLATSRTPRRTRRVSADLAEEAVEAFCEEFDDGTGRRRYRNYREVSLYCRFHRSSDFFNSKFQIKSLLFSVLMALFNIITILIGMPTQWNSERNPPWDWSYPKTSLEPRLPSWPNFANYSCPLQAHYDWYCACGKTCHCPSV